MSTLAHLADLVDQLDRATNSVVMPWTCPVPFFGALRDATVATVGLNPSSREFVDEYGRELTGAHRRFPTLASLKLRRWSQANSYDISEIVDACDSYFERQPYDRWFRVLDQVLVQTSTSYYDESARAAHVDLVPFATKTKWGELSPLERSAAARSGTNIVAALIAGSPIKMLVLNGQSVVEAFIEQLGISFRAAAIPEWTLSRRGSRGIVGMSYSATIDELCGESLDRSVQVIGFNHNLQSSYGMTSSVLMAIRQWIGVNWAASQA